MYIGHSPMIVLLQLKRWTTVFQKDVGLVSQGHSAGEMVRAYVFFELLRFFFEVGPMSRWSNFVTRHWNIFAAI